MESPIIARPIFAVVFSLLCLPAMAGTIGYTSFVTATATLPAVSSSFGGNSFSAPGQTVSNTGVNSTSASVDEFITEYGMLADYYPSGISGLFEASANATANVRFGYLALDTYAAAEDWSDGLGPYSSANATASAGFSDTMTIFGGTGTATLYWYYDEGLDSVPPGASFQLTLNLPTQATFGVPFDFSVSGQLQDVAIPFYGQGTAQAFFFIWPLGFTVNGSSSFLYATGSGTQYFDSEANAIFAPEPSYVCMIAGILCVLIFARRFARS